jgi:hypothetical protein
VSLDIVKIGCSNSSQVIKTKYSAKPCDVLFCENILKQFGFEPDFFSSITECPTKLLPKIVT